MQRLKYPCIFLVALTVGCLSEEPSGLAPAHVASTTVAMDFYNKPIPTIPLPNNIATRFDATSATKRRINASMVAPTKMESHVRKLLNELDGWGAFQPITIPFTGPLDVRSIMEGHQDPYYELHNDVVYLVNIDRDSANFGKVHHLDIGNGNYPVTVERRANYWKNDQRDELLSIVFEEVDEDLNGNGILDLGEDLNGNGNLDAGEDTNGNGVLDLPEDSDGDGFLDKPNYYPGHNPAWDDLAGRADAMMTFYEKQSHTLIVRPMVPLDERTTYAVIVTRRILDAQGEPVGSPFPFVNHTAQTEELKPLLEVMPEGLKVDEIAFAFSYTTQTISSAMVAVRDGLYGHGVQKHLSEVEAKVASIEVLRDEGQFPGMTNPHIMYSEQWAAAFRQIMEEFDGRVPDSEDAKVLAEAQKYIDYFVIGSFESPQLFDRFDAEGNWLPLNDQAWPEDLGSKAAKARPERVYFTLSVPRKEISGRGNGEQVPIAIQGHGYGSNRFEGMQLAGHFAKYGFATISIDGPSHGLPLGDLENALARGILGAHGLGNASDALGKDRAFNQDHDVLNRSDSGADFWTAYLFHTRDVVRQFTLDYMQLVRMIRSFDGVRTWEFDVDGNGTQELAGDFDGDGIPEIGKDSKFVMVGGSLGGIMSMMVGGTEPEIEAIAPIAGGGGYVDMGIRTTQGGAVEGFILRALAPLYVGTLDEDNTLTLETVVPDLNRAVELKLATIADVQKWDTMVVENLATGEMGCSYINGEGHARTGVASDVGDATRITIYKGPQLAGGEECELRSGAVVRAMVDTFEENVEYQTHNYVRGEPLTAIAEGLGLKRANPDLRRFVGIGQLVLEPADPVSYARHLLEEPLHYPGTNQWTGTHILQITTLGDTSVPATSGVTYGRAAGLINYLEPSDRFPTSENQMLIDTYTVEGIHNLDRYIDDDGRGVHLDIENFSRSTDMWGEGQPRSEQPSRLNFNAIDKLGGRSTSIFPMGDPQGQHGFDMPRRQTEKMLNSCQAACVDTPQAPNCDCITQSYGQFDVGMFMFNMVGRFFTSFGLELSDDLCQSRDDCGDVLPIPPERDLTILP